MRRDLPHGTVTFLFTDVEGSTRLLHELGAEAYADALAEHRALIRQACAKEGGVEVDTQGDAFFFAFSSAPQAVAAASAFTEALAPGPIQVRVGLHTGTPLLTSEGYVGDDVHFAARVAASAHGGQVVLSQATASLLEAELQALGSHRLKDVSEPVSLYQLGAGSFPPLKTIANTNLPTPASSFLGREQELYEADALLQETRLLTVTGPGGQGKTRFCLELATRAREERFSDYPDGVFSCFLSSLRDPALVLPTICQTLSVPEQPGVSALEALAAHLQGKRMLLLLDNLEHLLDAASELSQLLLGAGGLTLLVSSREVLRVQGETPYPLPPLAAEDGIALFCERAHAEPTPEIASLCARLEGLPLALELAAARLAVLTPAQLTERLSRRLDLLKAGRDADPRQQTLRATIEWSYDLLSPQEQRLFRALSVFAGGCTLEAAEEVAGADLDTLSSLVDKSLLRFSEERFWMLETIREYAAEKLAQGGEGVDLRRRRLKWLTRYLEATAPQLFRRADPARVRDLFVEEANIRSAFADAVETKATEDVFALLALILRAYVETGRLGELRRWARLALELDGGRDEQRATAVLALGLEDPEGMDNLLRARELYQRAGATRDAAIAYSCIGMNLSDREDFEGALRVFEEAVGMFAALGDEEGELVARGNLVSAIAANASTPSEIDDAIALVRERIADPREDPFDVLPSRMQLCSLLLVRGSLADARDELMLAADLLETLGQQRLLPELLSLAAQLAALEGNGYRSLGFAAAAESLGREFGVVPWQGFDHPAVDPGTAMRARSEGTSMSPGAALAALRALGEREVTGDE